MNGIMFNFYVYLGKKFIFGILWNDFLVFVVIEE